MSSNPFIPASAVVGGDRSATQRVASAYWSSRKAPGATGTRRMSRTVRLGHRDFTIDPDRLEAYRRRKAAVRGIAQQTEDDRRKADRAYEVVLSQARRHTAERKRVPDSLAAEMARLKQELDVAQSRYDEAAQENLVILAIAERIEKYVLQHAADAAERDDRSRWDQIEGSGNPEGEDE